MKNTSLLFLVGAVIVVGAIGYSVTRKAPTPDTMAPSAVPTEDDGMTDDEMAEEAGAVTTTMPVPGTDTTEMVVADDAVTIAVSGVNFAFDKKEIRVKEGQTVKIVFTSESGFHDWVVDEFSARTGQVMTGGVTEVTFVASKKGTFEYYCSVGAHRANGMVGQLIVE